MGSKRPGPTRNQYVLAATDDWFAEDISDEGLLTLLRLLKRAEAKKAKRTAPPTEAHTFCP